MGTTDLHLKLGNLHPFDKAVEEWGEEGQLEEGDWAYKAARGVISNLKDRRGIKGGFNESSIDLGIRCEIVTALADIIREARIRYA